jgi:tRNA(Ser,Leu) C12 N-acetylase TAN1
MEDAMDASGGGMHDWNVVITVQQDHFADAWRLLEALGDVGKSDYFNVLLMRVYDTKMFMDELAGRLAGEPQIGEILARVMPVTVSFDFYDPQAFEEQAKRAVDPWVAALAGKRFHVRMHRRGFRGRLSSQQEERFLDHYLMGRLAAQDEEAEIDFDDPDAIIALETVGQRAGLSLWSREDLQHYPLLKLD